MTEQRAVNKELIKMSRELDIPLVAKNDCHYLDAEDYRAHDVLLCIRDGRTVHDPDRFRYDSQDFYFRSGEEMEMLFKDLPEAIKNTTAIAEKCNVTLDLGKHQLPQFQPPEGMDLKQYLQQVSHDGLEERIKSLPYEINTEEYGKRLDDELVIINEMGFAGYFLIVWDFIEYAHQNNIPVGPGRRSATCRCHCTSRD